MDETALDGFAVGGDGRRFALTCLACGDRCRDLTGHDRVSDLIRFARLHQTVCSEEDS